MRREYRSEMEESTISSLRLGHIEELASRGSFKSA